MRKEHGFMSLAKLETNSGKISLIFLRKRRFILLSTLIIWCCCASLKKKMRF